MTTPLSIDAKTVIFCTKTAHAIDILAPGQDGAERIAALAVEYGPDLTLLSPSDALDRSEAPFISGVEEITEDRFHEMLNILPPMGWRTDSDGESFKMCEYTAGRVTAIFVRIGQRYATFSDRASTPHRECCRRAAEFFSRKSGTPRQADNPIFNCLPK
jgi:hypothetical protein